MVPRPLGQIAMVDSRKRRMSRRRCRAWLCQAISLIRLVVFVPHCFFELLVVDAFTSFGRGKRR